MEVHASGLHTFELPARVPVAVDSELEDGVADQGKALVGLRAVNTGCVESFAEETQVFEGVAEGVADVLGGVEGAGLFLWDALRLFLRVWGCLLTLGGGGGDVVRR